MVAVFSTPVLSVTADAVRDLEGQDALSGLWTIFTKCKESLQDGPRLENIAWRLWHRELRHSDCPNQFDEKDRLISELPILDEKAAYRPPTPTESVGLLLHYPQHSQGDAHPQITPIPTGHSQGTARPPTPLRPAPSTSCSQSTIPRPGPSIPPPIRRLSSTSSRGSGFLGGTPVSVGRIIYDMLPSSSASSSSGSSDGSKSGIAALTLHHPGISRQHPYSNVSSPPDILSGSMDPLSAQENITALRFDPTIHMTAIASATSPPRENLRPTKVLLPGPSSVMAPSNAVSCLPTPETEVEPAPKLPASRPVSTPSSASASLIPPLASSIPIASSSENASAMTDTTISEHTLSSTSTPPPNSGRTSYTGPPSPSLSESYARAHPAEVVAQDVGLLPSLGNIATAAELHLSGSEASRPHTPLQTNLLLPQPPTLVVVNPTPNPTPHPTPPTTPLLSGVISASAAVRSHWLAPPGLNSVGPRNSQGLVPPPSLMLPPSSAAMLQSLVDAGNSALGAGGDQPSDRSRSESAHAFGDSSLVIMVPTDSVIGDARVGRQSSLVMENDDRVEQCASGQQPQLFNDNAPLDSYHHQHPQRPGRDSVHRHSTSSSASNTTASDRSSASGTTAATSATTVSEVIEHGKFSMLDNTNLATTLLGHGHAPTRNGSLSTIHSMDTLADGRKDTQFSDEDDIGMVTVSDDDEEGSEEDEDDDEPTALRTALPSTTTIGGFARTQKNFPPPMSVSPTAAGPRQSPRSASSNPPLSARTVSSGSSVKRKTTAAAGAASRRGGRSSSAGGSSVGQSRSRSREHIAGGATKGLAALGMTFATPLAPAAPAARKPPVGAGKARPKFSLGRGVSSKARLGITRRNSAGPGLGAGGAETEALDRELERERVEKADMERMRAEALEIERRRSLEQDERVRAAEEEVKLVRQKKENERVAAELQRRNEEREEIERQRQAADRLAAPNVGEGSSRRLARFNIGSNSDEGSGLGSKSAGSGSDMSGGRSAGGYYPAKIASNEAHLEQDRVGAEKSFGGQQQQPRPQQQQGPQQHTLQNQQPRQMTKEQLRQLQMMMNSQQQHQNYHISSKPPSRQASTKQLEPFQGFTRVSDKAKGKEREVAPVVQPGPAPLTSKQPTKNNSTATVAPKAPALDTDLAAKVRDSLADPLLPRAGRKVVLATESEFETDSDEDGSWSSEDNSAEESEEQRRKEDQLRRDFALQQQRLEQEQRQRAEEQAVLLRYQQQQQQPQQPARLAPVQRTHSSHYPAFNNARGKQAAARARQQQADIDGAAKELARQQSMINKLPTSSFQDLAKARTRSVGLLTQLMNPNPEIFPANHPYRRGFSSGTIRPPHGLTAMAPMTQANQRPPTQPNAPKPAPPAPAPLPAVAAQPQVPSAGRLPPRRHASTDDGRKQPPSRTSMSPPMRLQTAKSAAARPVSSQIQVGSMSTKAAPSVALTSGGVNGSGSGGYRPKGRPVDQEMEDDSESEAEAGRIQMAESVAEKKLKALAERRGIVPHRSNTGPGQLQAGPSVYGDDDDAPEWARVSQAHQGPQQHARTQSQGQNRQSMNGLHFTQIPNATPIPLGHPYNLPPPAVPMTPRTTRRQMLATELSESLRRNLLWERQVSKVNLAAVKRSASGGGSRNNVLGGLKPLTTAPSMVQLHAKGTIPPEQQQEEDERERRHRAGPSNEGDKDAKKKAMARNRSWADDYHYSGW